MARTVRDDLKRKVAQSVNHAAAAILDVNEVYTQFKDAGKVEAEILEQDMIALNAIREHLLSFARHAWMLDEPGLMSYL